MNGRERNLAELAVRLAVARPGDTGMVAADALALQRISRGLHKVAEADCNYGNSVARTRRERRLEVQARAIATGYGLAIYHQGDPRGWALYLYDRRALNGHEIGSCYSSIGVGVSSH